MKSSLKDNFCSSLWFHIRIDPQGNFLPCRWSSHQDSTGYNIANTSILEFMNSDVMQGIRTRMLDGDSLAMCSACYYEDSNNKVSGRQRQLLKSAINIRNFNKTFCASPQWEQFKYSYDHHGQTLNQPVDLQIDLGNTCNSACVMCSPTYSSKLATDYIKLNTLAPNLFPQYPKLANWTDDDLLVDKFVNELINMPNIRYIHFLGGETLYLKSFYRICDRLIAAGVAKNISIGTTTNGTIYTSQLEYIIKEFKHVHLGLSIEAFHPVNDYIRYPGDINQITENIKKFLELRKNTDLQISLRITPNILSVFHLSTVFKFMLDNSVIAESCNILHNPSCLRIELLPQNLRQEIIADINQLITDYNLVESNTVIINRRREDLVDPVITSVIFEYRNFLSTYQIPADIEEERHNLVKFVKAFESLRNNTILNYLPEYEEFLRSYSY